MFLELKLGCFSRSVPDLSRSTLCETLAKTSAMVFKRQMPRLFVSGQTAGIWLRSANICTMEQLTPQTLNKGLELALEWGEHFGQPIQTRLSRLESHLSAEQLEVCQQLCQEVKYFAFDQIYRLYQQGIKDPSLAQYQQPLLEKYPWVSQQNLSRLLNQGRYYAWRDFG